MVESPARRAGPKAYPRHILPDCSRSVHMFDHPSWVSLVSETNAEEIVWNQCMRAPVPAEAPIKSTIWLCTPDIAKHVRREFGEPPASLCQHPPGTHKALRGTDSAGSYVTSSSRSENYSAAANLSIARVFVAMRREKFGYEAPPEPVLLNGRFSYEIMIGVAGVVQPTTRCHSRISPRIFQPLRGSRAPSLLRRSE